MKAIVIHLYYIEMLDDLCGHLDGLRKHMDFDVFVTTRNALHTWEHIMKLSMNGFDFHLEGDSHWNGC